MDIGLYIAMQVLILMMHLTAELIKLAGFLLRVLIELSCKLRLLPCVLYAAVVAIFFEPWAEAHTILALGILIALGGACRSLMDIYFCRVDEKAQAGR